MGKKPFCLLSLSFKFKRFLQNIFYLFLFEINIKYFLSLTESIDENLITYDDVDPGQTEKLPDQDGERDRLLAEYFTDHSWSSGDSHVNTFEFYDELQRVNFDITKNKKLMAVLESRRLRNKTIQAKIEQKIAAKRGGLKEE